MWDTKISSTNLYLNVYPISINSRQRTNKHYLLHKRPSGSQQTTKVPIEPNESPMNQDAKGSIGPNEPKLTNGLTDPSKLKTQT